MLIAQQPLQLVMERPHQVILKRLLIKVVILASGQMIQIIQLVLERPQIVILKRLLTRAVI